MADLTRIRQLTYDQRWSTARALASGCGVALRYVREHARRTPAVMVVDEGFNWSWSEGHCAPEAWMWRGNGSGAGMGSFHDGDGQGDSAELEFEGDGAGIPLEPDRFSPGDEVQLDWSGDGYGCSASSVLADGNGGWVEGDAILG